MRLRRTYGRSFLYVGGHLRVRLDVTGNEAFTAFPLATVWQLLPSWRAASEE